MNIWHLNAFENKKTLDIQWTFGKPGFGIPAMLRLEILHPILPCQVGIGAVYSGRSLFGVSDRKFHVNIL
jgi:hypothetical protein